MRSLISNRFRGNALEYRGIRVYCQLCRNKLLAITALNIYLISETCPYGWEPESRIPKFLHAGHFNSKSRSKSRDAISLFGLGFFKHSKSVRQMTAAHRCNG